MVDLKVKKIKKSSEPFWWALFGAGGVISAMLMPVLVFIFGIAVPLGWISGPDYETMQVMIEPLIVRIFLLGLISLSFMHWAHRFRFTLYDGLQVKHLNELIAIICYGGAIAGSIAAIYILFII
jgi:fumarate reductase subunit D